MRRRRVVRLQRGQPHLLRGAALVDELAVGHVVAAAHTLRVVDPEAADAVGQRVRVLFCPEALRVRRNEARTRAADGACAERIRQEQRFVGRRARDLELILLEIARPAWTARSVRTELAHEDLIQERALRVRAHRKARRRERRIDGGDLVEDLQELVDHRLDVGGDERPPAAVDRRALQCLVVVRLVVADRDRVRRDALRIVRIVREVRLMEKPRPLVDPRGAA